MLEKPLSTLGRVAHTLTPDSLELEGFFAEPSHESESVIFVQIHGMFENFHLPLFIKPMSERITESGFSFLTVNTRAKDYFVYFRHYKEDGSFIWKQEGGSYEIFANCIPDIKGWLNFCETLNKKVILMGHSHGALKAAFYGGTHPDDHRILGLVLISPSDDVGGQISKVGDKYDEYLEIAESMINEGKGNEFMPDWTYGQPVTASMYFDMFRSNSDLAIFRFDDPNSGFDLLHNIKQPILTIFGSNDVATSNVTSERALELIDIALSSAPSHTRKVIEDADHHFIGKEKILSNTIVNWAATELSLKIA